MNKPATFPSPAPSLHGHVPASHDGIQTAFFPSTFPDFLPQFRHLKQCLSIGIYGTKKIKKNDVLLPSAQVKSHAHGQGTVQDSSNAHGQGNILFSQIISTYPCI